MRKTSRAPGNDFGMEYTLACKGICDDTYRAKGAVTLGGGNTAQFAY